jgi:hypothetical protein
MTEYVLQTDNKHRPCLGYELLRSPRGNRSSEPTQLRVAITAS